MSVAYHLELLLCIQIHQRNRGYCDENAKEYCMTTDLKYRIFLKICEFQVADCICCVFKLIKLTVVEKDYISSSISR